MQFKYEFPRTIQGVTFTAKVETRVKQSKSKNTKKRRRRNKSHSGRADDFTTGLDNLQDISEGSTVLQRAIMYQMEQKLPKLSGVKSARKKEKSKKRRVAKDDKSVSHKMVDDETSKSLLPLESLPGTKTLMRLQHLPRNRKRFRTASTHRMLLAYGFTT